MFSPLLGVFFRQAKAAAASGALCCGGLTAHSGAPCEIPVAGRVGENDAEIRWPTGSWYEHMDMGMMLQRSGPGVQDGKNAEFAADMFRIETDGHEGFGRRLHEDVIERFLVAADDLKAQTCYARKFIVDGRQARLVGLVGDPTKMACAAKIGAKTRNPSTRDGVLGFNSDWRARRDSNSRQPGSKPGTLSS